MDKYAETIINFAYLYMFPIMTGLYTKCHILALKAAAHSKPIISTIRRFDKRNEYNITILFLILP